MQIVQTSFYELDFRWACDDTVTHYIYQGRVGDNTREYRGVKERGLHVVSQYWLQAVCSPVENINGTQASLCCSTFVLLLSALHRIILNNLLTIFVEQFPK